MGSALLIIDMQRWFLEVGPAEKRSCVDALLTRVNELSKFFRDTHLPVIRIQTVHKADGSTWNLWMKEHQTPRLLEGTPEAEEHSKLGVADTDILIQKTRHSAFIRTNLEEILRQQSIGSLIICGFSTNLCIGLTAIEAYERDFKVALAGDAILGTSIEEGGRMLDYLRTRFEIEALPNETILKNLGREG